MYPWEQYPPEDPRSYPMNYVSENGVLVYIGPEHGVPIDAQGTVQGSAPAPTEYNYAAAEPYGSGTVPTEYNYAAAEPYGSGVAPASYPDPSTQAAVDPTYSNPAPSGMPREGSGTLYVPEWTPDVGAGLATVGNAVGGFVSGAGDAIGGLVGGTTAAPPYDPLSSAYTTPEADPTNYDAGGNYVGPLTLGGGPTAPPGGPTIGYGSGQSDFVTPMTPVYVGGPAATTPPYATDPALGGLGTAPPYDPATGQAIDPGYGYDAGYGGGGGYAGVAAGYGGGFAGDPGMGPSFGGAYDAGAFGGGQPPTPYGFDPFFWSQVRNPLPPPTPMRQQIMAEGGFSGPAWYPAPPPQPPGPMSYVRSRLGMQDPGNALEMKPPVPGFRFDGTPRDEPQEQLESIVAPEEAMRWQAEADERNRMAQFMPPMPPAFPRRTGY